MPIYGIVGIFRDFLAYNLAKFNETKFIRLILSNYISYSMQVSAKYLQKYGFDGQKTSKMSQNQLYLVCAFCSISNTNIATPPTCFDIFS